MAYEEENQCNVTPEGEDCPKHKKKCCKTEEKKRKKGMYGLQDEDSEGDESSQENGGMPQDSANEAREFNVDTDMKDMSTTKKKKAMDSFRERSQEAKKRKLDKDKKDELASERMTKGIRFFDKKGSGYIKQGKKSYD
jgi:hypothetical protein